MSSLELMVYRLNIQARAQTWADLEPAELRRRAVEAARDGDVQALWDMTEAYVLLQGLAGARVSEHTLRAYKTGVALFAEYARPAGVQLLRPRPNHGVAYARWLEAKGLSTSSVRVRLAAARSLYAALRWAGATDAVPFADVRPGRDPVARTEKRKPYSPDDLKQLLAHAHPEEAVMILLGAHAGLRSSEIAGLPRMDLHLDEPEPFLVVTGKRQKRQSVPLSGTLTLALRRWLALSTSVGPQVLSGSSADYVQERMRQLCARAGVRYAGRHVHGLRHTAGTQVYAATGDLLAVRDHLRHADITSSEIYVEYARKGKRSVVSDW